MTVAFAPRGDTEAIERGTALMPKFDADGLIPAIAADADSGAVLMMAWMNAEALSATIETGEAHYWSRSRGELWHKGASSGHVQLVRDIRVDCDQDTVLLLVEQKGPGACHVGYASCFYRRVARSGDGPTLEILGAQTYDPETVYRSGA